MTLFERYLTLWVALCIIAGIALGHLLPSAFAAIAALEVANVNLAIAVLIWAMIVPMLMRVNFGALGSLKGYWRGIGVTLFVNWVTKPFSMALLGTLFLGYLFAPFLPAGAVSSYVAGLILLASAPCTAMVFVWSNLVDGEPNYTLSQVALNDLIMVFAFAPLVSLLLTLVLLFGFQGEQIVRQPLVIALIAVPILFQVYLNAGIAYWLSRRLNVVWCVAGPSALIGASNFFELAVAAAISLFGLTSGAALATVVGVLVEVPVMLSIVALVKRSRGWYEKGIIA